MPEEALKSKAIVLVGPMGCGKSTIGRALAQSLHKDFLDLDDKIVADNGMSIPDIFAKFSEDGFRTRETVALKQAISSFNGVIASGGGIISRELNCQLLKHEAFAVYLYCDVEVQYQRTLHDNNRPMIYADDRRARLQELFLKRDPLYRSVASWQIDSGSHDVAQCVALISEKLKQEGLIC